MPTHGTVTVLGVPPMIPKSVRPCGHLCEQRIDLRWRSISMADQRRRVEDMTAALSILLLELQKNFSKKYTQKEAGDLVQQALMRDRYETLQVFFATTREIPSIRDAVRLSYRPSRLSV